MKNLSEYILDNIIFTSLAESLVCHMNCIVSIYNFHIILEHTGSYDNISNIVHKLYDSLLNDKGFHNNKTNIIVEFDNEFFSKITLNVSYKGNSLEAATYSKNNVIYVDLMLPDDFNDSFVEYEYDILELLAHEILHQWEDYNRKKNDKESIYDLVNPKEYNLSKMLISITDNECKKIASELSYFLNDQEINAYVGEIVIQVERIMKNMKMSYISYDPNKILDEVKKLDLWKRYRYIISNVIKIKDNCIDEDNTKLILTHYRYLNKKTLERYDIKDDKEIVDFIYRRAQKLKKKINVMIPKAIVRNFLSMY